jgi:hypothetical protein
MFHMDWMLPHLRIRVKEVVMNYLMDSITILLATSLVVIHLSNLRVDDEVSI